MLFTNKVAIVTGGAQGIGLSIAKRLAREGAKVVIADVCDEAGQKAVHAINATGAEAIFRATDVAEQLDVHNLIAVTCEAFGRIDILINNAGILDDMPFLELDGAEFDRILQTNLKGAFMISQAVARRMVKQAEEAGREPVTGAASSQREQTAGSIVNVTSVNAFFGMADHVAYSVSKGGVMQLTKSMALALAGQNIRVNAVAPGTVETQFLNQVMKTDKGRERTLSRTPMGRFAEPDEIASIVAWLASDEASYLTGTTIWADGGRMSLNTVMPSND